MTKNKEEKRYLGANIPVDLYDFIVETGRAENRDLGKQTTQLLQEARNLRENIAKQQRIIHRPSAPIDFKVE